MNETGMKKEQNELVRLSIRNADVTEKAYNLLKKVDETFLQKLSAVVKETVETTFNGWGVYFKWRNRKGELCFFSNAWPVDDNDNVLAWFSLNSVEADLWLNTIGEIYFEFGVTANVDTWGENNNELQRQQDTFFAAHEDSLRKAGFLCEDGCIYRPFKLEVEALAEAWPEWGDEVFEPVRKALEDIRSVVPLFEDFVAELQQNRQA